MLSKLFLRLCSRRLKVLFIAGVCSLSLSAFADLVSYEKSISGGRIRFLRESSQSPEEFSRSFYRFKPDPAALEKKLPLKAQDLMALQIDDFAGFTQEEIDQIYLRLPTGVLQLGDYEGKIFARSPLANHLKNIFLISNLDKSLAETICQSRNLLDCLLGIVWKEKRIRLADPESNELVANSVLNPVGLSKSLGKLGLDNMFPAHIYCGQSLYDHRRESHIIDHSWGKDFKSALSGLDSLVGPGFLNLREEFRMIRTDLFLGRVYANKVYLTSIVLKQKPSGAQPHPQGHQQGSVCNRD